MLYDFLFHSTRYRWFKDGRYLNLTEHDRIIKKSGSGMLTFLKPNENDEGEYFCLAKNKDGTARSTSVKLKRTFLENFKNDSVQTIEVQVGQPLKLECKAPDGYPKPSIVWLIQTDIGAIKNIDNPRVTLDPVGNLWFTSVSFSDANKDSYYVCSASSYFINEYKLGNRIKLEVIPYSANTKSLSGTPPTPQYVTSNDVRALRGKKVELFCIYHGVPMPKIAWSKNGKPIEYDERVILENYGKSLKIKNTDVEDEGEYSCEASSEIGEKQISNFRLKLEFPPHFTVEPQSRNATLNEEFEIKCVAEGVPKPKVQWFFNGNLAEEGIDTTKIVVKDTQNSDGGNYACVVSNAHGLITKNIYVNVN